MYVIPADFGRLVYSWGREACAVMRIVQIWRETIEKQRHQNACNTTKVLEFIVHFS